MIASVIFSSVCSGIPVRVVTRPGSQLLGINGRDDGPLVSLIVVPLVGSRCWLDGDLVLALCFICWMFLTSIYTFFWASSVGFTTSHIPLK